MPNQQNETRKWDHVGGREAAVAERLGKLSSKSTTYTLFRSICLSPHSFKQELSKNVKVLITVF